MAVDGSKWRATCRDGALLLDDGVPRRSTATVASAACLFPSSKNEFPDDALVALALRICGDDEAKLSAMPCALLL